MCKKCICLIRVSTQKQDLDAQREKVIANAIADGYKKSEIVLVEKKESAIKLSEMERESLNEMKSIIKDNPAIESVYVFAIDRLARKVSIVLSIKEYLTERGINLVFINPHKMSTLRKDEKTNKMVEDELTSMLLMFLSYGAQMEMKIKQERFKAVKDMMKKQNKLTSGKPVFGYRKNVDGTISIDEVESQVVRDIYNEVLVNNKSIKMIEREMIAKGVFKEKKRITGSTVRYICANKCYYGGTTTFGSTVVYPAIISKDEFDAMQKKMAENRKSAKKDTKYIRLCKGILRNADSKSLMIYNTSSRSYVCNYTHQNLNAETMHFLAWYVAKSLYTIQKAVQNDNRTDEYKVFIAQNNAQIDTIKEMLSRVEERQRKAFKMYLDGKVSDAIYNEQIEIINKEIEDWNKQIAKLESENKRLAFETSKMSEKTQWSSTDLDNIDSLEVKKEIINSVIKEIEVYKEDKGVYKLFVTCADIKVQKLYEELRQEFTYKVSGHKITLLDKILEKNKYVTRDITKYIKTNETPDLLISSI